MKRIFIIAFGILLSCSAYAQKVKIEHLTKSDFLTKVWNYETSSGEWKYLGTKPCIIDFYASWCGPCKRLAPILEELAEEYKEDIIIYKIDTEAERELAAAFQVSSIPMILFCPMEGQPQMAKGLLPKETLVEAITTVLIK